MATIEDFIKLDIRVGTIINASDFKGVHNPAYQLEVDFGPEIGIKKSSAQLTERYTPGELLGKQVLAVVNIPPKQIKDFVSEVLVLGTYSDGGVMLITPENEVQNGDKLG